MAEAIHDYVRFLKFDDQTTVWGHSKYTGGLARSNSNWAGVAGRPALLIPAPKFVVHFKTNGTVNDYGFKMQIVPLINESEGTEGGGSFSPEISSRARSYHRAGDEAIHERLYKEGQRKAAELHNIQVSLVQGKLNIPLRPWETHKDPSQPSGRQSGRSSQSSRSVSTILPTLQELLVPPHMEPTVALVEYDELLGSLWRDLRTATLEGLEGYAAPEL